MHLNFVRDELYKSCRTDMQVLLETHLIYLYYHYCYIFGISVCEFSKMKCFENIPKVRKLLCYSDDINTSELQAEPFKNQ